MGLCKRDPSDRSIYQTHSKVCHYLGMVLPNLVLPKEGKPKAFLLLLQVADAKGRDRGLRKKLFSGNRNEIGEAAVLA